MDNLSIKITYKISNYIYNTIYKILLGILNIYMGDKYLCFLNIKFIKKRKINFNIKQTIILCLSSLLLV